eukprot:TRINITY_DN8854_c0_g2_i1.p1 TRINITY_DN8854_c0_g2~~TRINITY_DN8854_c0_g2_i1.p1  ORF type:complete len:489 (+),score=82.81 TRINITY_DN8854_c0_g2_i1:103-1569(+)
MAAVQLSSAIAAFSKWWSPRDHMVVEGVVREIFNSKTLVWVGWALGGAGLVRLSLLGLELYDGGKIPTTLQRLYPKGWKEIRDMAEGLPMRVIGNVAGDCLQLFISLTLAKVLELLGVIRWVPGTRFTSFYQVYDSSAGIAHHRVKFIMTSCVPPIFRTFITCPPRGSLSQPEVLHLERTCCWQDLLVIEVFPAIVRMMSSYINLSFKMWFGKLTRSVQSSFLSKNSAMLLWLASLLVLTPLAKVRHHLNVRAIHLVPFVVFGDVVYSAGCFSWLFGGLFTWYYRQKGVLCPAIYPPAFLLTFAFEEQRVGRDDEESERLRTAVATAASSLQQNGLDYDLQSLESQLSSMSTEQAFNFLVQLSSTHQAQGPGLHTSTKLVTLTPSTAEPLGTEVCTVCQGPYEPGTDVRVLPCKHYYHKLCIDPWVTYNRSCPLCRKDVFALLGLQGRSEEGDEEEDDVGTDMAPEDSNDDDEHIRNWRYSFDSDAHI